MFHHRMCGAVVARVQFLARGNGISRQQCPAALAIVLTGFLLFLAADPADATESAQLLEHPVIALIGLESEPSASDLLIANRAPITGHFLENASQISHSINLHPVALNQAFTNLIEAQPFGEVLIDGLLTGTMGAALAHHADAQEWIVVVVWLDDQSDWNGELFLTGDALYLAYLFMLAEQDPDSGDPSETDPPPGDGNPGDSEDPSDPDGDGDDPDNPDDQW